MSDFISRKETMDRITDGYQNSGGGQDRYAVGINVGLTKALNVLKDVPSVEAEPVKRGYWEEFMRIVIPHPYNRYEQAWKCSECGYDEGFLEWKYCPQCGARMVTDHE